MERIIYLDNSATTKPFDELKDIYQSNMANFYNPSALYGPAIIERKKVESARKNICEMIGGENGTIIFTSGATEANNLALGGINYAGGAELVISEGEHPSVYAKAKALELQGVKVKYVPLKQDGTIDVEMLKHYVTGKTAMVSIMMVSNETGAINDIKQINKTIKSINPKAIFHVDGVQALGKLPIDLMDLDIDLFTISAHKIHGPKGIGALWIKNGAKLHPIIFGGGQESNMRSGTENVAGILGFEYAVKKSIEDLKNNSQIVDGFKEQIINELKDQNIKFLRNGTNASPYILSICVPGIRGEVLVHELEKHNIYISTGSACSSKKSDNRTLASMGRTEEQIKGAIRISFSAYDNYNMQNVGKIIASEIRQLKQKIEGK